MPTATHSIEYGHDKQGGFYAIDNQSQIAYYAYPTSPNAQTAKSTVLAPRFVPGWLAAERKFRESHPDLAWAERWERLSREFRTKVSDPYWI